jgi:predicted enzyme related to lactoylglutathione lyase
MMTGHLFAAIALAGVVAAGTVYQQPSGTKKAPPPDVGSGRVAWFDITTTDIAASKAFYGGLFGWTFTPVPGAGDQAVEIVSRDLPIGTIRGADGAIAAFNGVVYIQVSDLPASCKKASALGGKVIPGFPFNLPDGRGAIALVADPSGHPIGMYSRSPLPSQK